MVPGGFGTRALEAPNPLLDWIRTAHESSRWTTSVCTGSMLLAAAGILKGLEATTHWMSLDRLPPYGARPTPKRVVEQGKVITAAGGQHNTPKIRAHPAHTPGAPGGCPAPPSPGASTWPRPSSSGSSTTRSRRSGPARPRPRPRTWWRACARA